MGSVVLAAVCLEIREEIDIPRICIGCDRYQHLEVSQRKQPAEYWLIGYSAYVKSNGEWIARCIVMGFFTAPVEALPEISVTDVYFTHERGTYMGVYALTLAGSNYFAPIISGFISEGQGWQWVFYWPAVFNAVTLVFLFFYLEETNYNRARYTESIDGIDPKGEDSSKEAFTVQSSIPSDALSAQKKSLAQKLSIWHPSPGQNMFFRAKRSLKYLG